MILSFTSLTLLENSSISFSSRSNKESEYLKKKGVNAIIVLGHVGLNCKNDSNKVKLEYKLRDKYLSQGTCRETDEAFILLNKLESNVIDLFLGGHKHDVAHNWINGIPFMSNDLNGKYAQIVYLPFDRKTKQLLNRFKSYLKPLLLIRQKITRLIMVA